MDWNRIPHGACAGVWCHEPICDRVARKARCDRRYQNAARTIGQSRAIGGSGMFGRAERAVASPDRGVQAGDRSAPMDDTSIADAMPVPGQCLADVDATIVLIEAPICIAADIAFERYVKDAIPPP